MLFSSVTKYAAPAVETSQVFLPAIKKILVVTGPDIQSPWFFDVLKGLSREILKIFFGFKNNLRRKARVFKIALCLPLDVKGTNFELKSIEKREILLKRQKLKKQQSAG